MLGELLATSFRARRAVGVILDAGWRDVAEMSKMGFPVWSKAVSAEGTLKATLVRFCQRPGGLRGNRRAPGRRHRGR
jgi:regulator of RNase E activity RraA